MKVEIRPATLADLDAYAVEQAQYRVRGYVGLIDGIIVGIGGIAYLSNGQMLAFLNLDQEARDKAPVALMKVAVRVLREARERGIQTINAVCDDTIPAASRFLARLGFVHAGDGVYQYRVK